MFRSRRALLWFPLLALTLFFAACGWRSWHLSMDKDELSFLAANYGLSKFSKSEMLSVWEHKQAPLSQRVKTYLKTRHPNIRFVSSEPLTIGGPPTLSLFVPVFKSRFFAICSVNWINAKNDSMDGGQQMAFRRSPLPWNDTRWHRFQGSR